TAPLLDPVGCYGCITKTTRETRRQRRRHLDSPRTTVLVGGSFGLVLAWFSLVAVPGMSIGGCVAPPAPPDSPVRDGLGIALGNHGRQVVTVDSGSGLLDVITGDRLTTQVVVGGQTSDVVLTPDGTDALVTDTAVGASSGYLVEVDLATATRYGADPSR
ncbi:MAG: hypothetical protein ACRD0Z_12935, partial [Acidimicrobiales bacterium]